MLHHQKVLESAKVLPRGFSVSNGLGGHTVGMQCLGLRLLPVALLRNTHSSCRFNLEGKGQPLAWCAPPSEHSSSKVQPLPAFQMELCPTEGALSISLL